MTAFLRVAALAGVLAVFAAVLVDFLAAGFLTFVYRVPLLFLVLVYEVVSVGSCLPAAISWSGLSQEAQVQVG